MCKKTYDFDIMKIYRTDNIENSFYKTNIYKKIDKIQNQISGNMTLMKKICTILSGYIADTGIVAGKKKTKTKTKTKKKTKKTGNDVKIYIKRNDRDGYYLYLTRLRALSLKKNISNLKKITITSNYSINPKTLKYKALKDATKIFFSDLSTKSDKIILLRDKMITIIKEQYITLLKIYYQKYGNILKKIADFIAYVDFIKSNAKTAMLYKYCKPTITSDDDEELLTYGYIRAKQELNR